MPAIPEIGSSPELDGRRQHHLALARQPQGLKALTKRSRTLRRAIEGEPRLIVRDGRLLSRAIKEEGLEAEEVRAAIRSHGLVRPEDVRLAVLETDGSISVVPLDDGAQPSNRPPSDERTT